PAMTWSRKSRPHIVADRPTYCCRRTTSRRASRKTDMRSDRASGRRAPDEGILAALAMMAALVWCGVAALDAQVPSTHTLRAGPSTIAWGYFDPDAKPVLTIASGDTVRV